MKHAVIPAAGVAVMLACAPALGAATVKSGKYTGTTDKGTPVSLKVTPSKQLVHFKFSKVTLKCTDGDSFVPKGTFDSGSKKLTITDSGKFGFTVTYQNGGRWTAKGKVKSNGKASGTLRFKVNFNEQSQADPNGSIVCDSGKRSFSLKH
jgi:hypothetical protein